MATDRDSAETLVLLSGGADSASALAFYVAAGRPTAALFVDYGQRAANAERDAARAIAEHFQAPLLESTWSGHRRFDTGLVPGRNTFLVAAAVLEAPRSVTAVALGIHAGTTYADCSPAFIAETQSLVKRFGRERVGVRAPFIEWSKAEVWAYARRAGVPIAQTYSCEDQNGPCGVCLSCGDRQELDAIA